MRIPSRLPAFVAVQEFPPGELEPVFQALLENAVRIFGAKFGNLLLYEEGAFRVAAMHDAPSVLEELRRRER